MESIYTRLVELLAAGETVAVATIIAVRGSAPREVGAKMIIHPFGQHVGTVGGGCGEADVIRAALDVIQTGQPAIVRVDLTEEISMQALGVCGGIMDVFVARATGQSQVANGKSQDGSFSGSHPLSRYEALLESIGSREPVALATVVSGPNAGREAVIWLDRPPLGSLGLAEVENPLVERRKGDSLEEQVIADARDALRSRQHKLLRYNLSLPDTQYPVPNLPIYQPTVFVEVQRRAAELLIVGAGHIAVPLAQIASLCDFAVTVLDDRPSFASPDRFPTAQKVIAAPLAETVAELPLDQDSFVVLVTRGHSHDVECLLEVLDRPVAYIGMIGSRRRVRAVFELLATEMGIDRAKSARVHAPIGLDIAARTPGEIAVSIMAEIVSVLRGGSAGSLAGRGDGVTR
jgi:xanthine dehydrogenase accessory factor